jgi:hypothetical protein
MPMSQMSLYPPIYGQTLPALAVRPTRWT